MLTPYVYADFGQRDPNDPTGWWGETVISLRYERAGSIATSVKQAVDGFGDGSGTGVFKHFVPWERIFRALEAACTDKTRNEVHTALSNLLGYFTIADASGITPTATRIAFDSWCSWAFDAICDWAPNIFRGDSHSDHRGTTLDVPIGASTALKQRLDAAARMLRDGIGVSYEFKQSFV